MTFLHILRRRVLWTVVCVAAATLAVVSWTALPALPIVAGGVAAIALAVNTLAARLRQDACLGCGESIAGRPHGEHGIICPSCGHLSSDMHLNDESVRPTLADAGLDDPDETA